MQSVIKRNNINIMGSGAPMLFAHGFIGDQSLWHNVAKRFADQYQVILFDYVGSGKSDASCYNSEKYSRVEGYAEDVLDICRVLNLKDVTLVAHSISCMIGLVAAIQEPHYFSKMIFVAPSPRYMNDKNYHGGFEEEELNQMMTKIELDYNAWAKHISPLIMNQPAMPALAEELLQKILSADHKRTMNFAKATFFADYRAALLKFKIPSLTLQCMEDVMAPVSVGDYLHAHLDNNVLKTIPVKGHFPQLSDPEQVVAAMQEFLDERRK